MPCTRCSATTSLAPATSPASNSHTAMSNPGEAVASSTSRGPSGYASCHHAMRLARAPCGTSTPLGRPVDPDVYMR